MLSHHIEDMITAIKAKPNGLHRNKALSHAQDMLAHVQLMEMEEGVIEGSNGRRGPENAPNEFQRTAFVRRDLMPDMKAKDFQFGIDLGGCTCPEGAIESTCPIHGSHR